MKTLGSTRCSRQSGPPGPTTREGGRSGDRLARPRAGPTRDRRAGGAGAAASRAAERRGLCPAVVADAPALDALAGAAADGRLLLRALAGRGGARPLPRRAARPLGRRPRAPLADLAPGAELRLLGRRRPAGRRAHRA